jgi:hypothetical protein
VRFSLNRKTVLFRLLLFTIKDLNHKQALITTFSSFLYKSVKR